MINFMADGTMSSGLNNHEYEVFIRAHVLFFFCRKKGMSLELIPFLGFSFLFNFVN